MKRSGVGCISAIVIAVLCSAAMGQTVKLEVALGYGMFSNFNAGTATQSLVGTNGAIVYSDDPYADPWYFSNSDIQATFTGALDVSNSGQAEARYNGGTWHMTLSSGGNAVFSIAGTVDWCWEKEDVLFPNKVDGQAKVTLTSVNIDNAFFGGHGTWATSDGKSALITSISGASPAPLQSYAGNWSSTNVVMILYADSSYAIPEPATMTMFALGSLIFLRKRK